ncbi:hypothetical protein NXV14_09135 [Bacteroides fragilis]|nr:hypothetical protein [Bacteroides fragilis]
MTRGGYTRGRRPLRGGGRRPQGGVCHSGAGNEEQAGGQHGKGHRKHTPQPDIGQSMARYYEGGKVTERERPGQDIERLNRAAEKLERASRNLSRPAKSYVLLSDINAAQDLQKSSEKPFTRTDQ